jgi:hypothetical protein
MKVLKLAFIGGVMSLTALSASAKHFAGHRIPIRKQWTHMQ